MRHMTDGDLNVGCPNLAAARVDDMLTSSGDRNNIMENQIGIWDKLSADLSRPVVVDVPHQHTTPPGKGPEFRVHYWSLPPTADRSYTFCPPRVVFGEKIGNTDSYSVPDNLENLFKYIIRSEDGINGMPIAVVDRNNLYLMWDACHSCTKGDRIILEKIAWHVVQMFKDPKPYTNDSAQLKTVKQKAKVTEGLTQFRVNAVKMKVDRIKQLDRDILQLSENIIALAASKDSEVLQVMAAEEIEKAATDTVAKQIEAMEAMPAVKGFTGSNMSMTAVINMDPVADSKGEKRCLGDLCIKIGLDPRSWLTVCDVSPVEGFVYSDGKTAYIPGVRDGIDIKLLGIIGKMVIEAKPKDALELVMNSITRGAASSSEDKNTFLYPKVGETAEVKRTSSTGLVDI